IRRIELEKEVKELRLLSDAYTNEISGKRARLSRLEKTISNFDSAIAEATTSAKQYAKIWTRTAPPPASVQKRMDATDDVNEKARILASIADKAVYEFGGQTVDTADKDGAITNKLDLWLLDRSKTAERQGKTYATETLTINGKPLTLRIDLTFAEQPSGGAVLDNRSHQLTNYSGAASLIQNLRRLPGDAQENVERLKRTNAQDQLTAQNLRAALDKVGPFPDAAKLSALEQEANEVDARLRAKSTPPEQQGGTSAPERILPPMQPADPKLLTEEVMSVLENADYLGSKVFIQEQLEPRLYKAVNKALESAGGQWDRRSKSHLFSGDPRPYLGLAPMPESSNRVAESTIQAYIDSSNVPSSLATAARTAINSALNRESGDSYEQGELFGPSPTRVSRRQPRSSGPTREQQAAAYDALKRGDTAAVRDAINAGIPLSSLMLQHVSRDVPSFDIRGAVIKSPLDFAAFNLAVRSPFFESVKIAVLDTADQVIHSQIVHVGAVNESILSLGSIASIIGHARRLNPKSKLSGFVLAHNHPSGYPSPSDADRRMTSRMLEMQDAIGVALIDHVITNGSKYFSFREVGFIDNRGVGPEGRDTKPKLPVLAPPPNRLNPDRAYGKFDYQADRAPWEAVSTLDRQDVSDNSLMSSVSQTLRTADPDHHHLLVLDTRLQVIAVERLPKNSSVRQFMRAFTQYEAPSFAVSLAPNVADNPDSSDRFPTSGLVKQLRNAAEALRVSLIDAVESNGASYREAGRIQEAFASNRQANSGQMAAAPVSYENAPLDPFTGAPSLITGATLTQLQGQAIGARLRQLLRSGLRRSEAQRLASQPAPARRAALYLTTLVTNEQMAKLRRLPMAGDQGVEADTFLDRQQGAVYKILRDGLEMPSFGIYPQLFYADNGKIDWRFEPAKNERELGIRLAVMTSLGGTPTEVVGVGPDGHVILKQPLSPQPLMPSAATDAAISAAGLQRIPQRLIDDPNAPPAYIGYVEGLPYLVTDLSRGNFIGDNQGRARINDPVVGQIPASLRSKLQGFDKLFADAEQFATQAGDRTFALFSNRPAVTSAQDAAYLAAVEAGDMETAQRMVDVAARAAGYDVEAWQGAEKDYGPTYKKGLFNAKIRSEDDRNNFGFYFARDELTASRYMPENGGGILRHVWLKAVNPLDLSSMDGFGGEQIQSAIDEAGVKFDFEGYEDPEVWRNLKDGDKALASAIKKAGYDGVLFNEFFFGKETPVTVVFSPNQIKSADPITRDEQGNVIPLSQRFNPDSDSILYTNRPTSLGSRPAAAWAFNQTDKAFTAAVGKVTNLITGTAPAQALADYVGNSKAGQFFGQAVAMLKKQVAPLSAIGPEALALYREMQTKSAFGKELSMDVFRALDGKGKFTDLAYPPGFANNTAAKKDLYLAMTGGKPMTDLSTELQTLAGQLRALLVKAGQEAVSAGRMSTDTFQNLTGTYLPHYYAQDGEQEAVWTKAARVLGIKDVLAQRTTAWHLVDTETADAKTGKKGDEGALVTWDNNGSQWRFRSGEHLLAFYNDFIKDKVWDRLRGRRDKELQGLTRASLDSPESLTAYQRGIVREMTLAARARYKRKAPLIIEE
ncbi:MAG: JAB domain-containing protein, partial [Roseimicrobium sp.]